jgi:hypothetical protein
MPRKRLRLVLEAVEEAVEVEEGQGVVDEVVVEVGVEDFEQLGLHVRMLYEIINNWRLLSDGLYL